MIFSIALILISGVALGGIFKKMKLPPMIAFLIIGVVFGPYALDLISPELVGGIDEAGIAFTGLSPDIREIGLAIILLRSGLELDVACLKKAGRAAIFMCFFPAIFEIAAIVIFGPMFFDITYIEAAMLGCILGAVSPAIVAPRLIRLTKEGYGNQKSIPQVLLMGASMDDIFCLVIFASFLTQYHSGSFSPLDILKIPGSIAISIVLGVAVGVILVKTLKKLELSKIIKVVLFLGVSLAMVAIEIAIEEHELGIPFSGMLCVVAFGSTVFKLNGHLAEEVSDSMGAIWTFMEIVLFVLVGASVDLNFNGKEFVFAVLLIAIGLIIRSIGVYLSFVKTNLNFKERIYCIIASAPKATVQASLGALPLASGVEGGAVILLVSILSIFLTAPLGAIAMDLSYKKLVTKDEEQLNVPDTFMGLGSEQAT